MVRSAVRSGAGHHSPRRVFYLAPFACMAVLAARGPATPALDMGVTGPPADSLDLDLVVPARVRGGERVPITLRVLNRAGRPFDLYLRGRTATFDVVITGPGGPVVWRRLQDEIIPAIVHLRTLAPAERFELETVWDQRTKEGKLVQPGEFSARGFLLVEGKPLEAPAAPFRIDPS